MPDNKIVPVKFTFTDKTGKKATREMLVEKGITIRFGGTTNKEQGKYTIDKNGVVHDASGKKVNIIQTTKEQMAALQGMSRTFDEPDIKRTKSQMVLTERDIANANKDPEHVQAMVNDLEDRIGSGKRVHEFTKASGFGINKISGEYLVQANDENSVSTVGVSTAKTVQQAKNSQWAQDHPILNFFKNLF